MIRVALVDDESRIRKKLEHYINDYAQESNEKFCILTYEDAADLVSKYKPVYDIIFMDIMMEKMDGMTAAKKIRKMDKNVIIIFVTNMENFAVQGYKVGAFSYVVKPVQSFDFEQQFDKAVKKVQQNKNAYLLVTSNSEIIRLDITKISYMESNRHQVIIHMDQEKIIVYGSLKKFEKELEGYFFSRCNNCYLVSLRHIDAIEQDTAIIGGDRLSISRSKKKSFMKDFVSYIGGEF